MEDKKTLNLEDMDNVSGGALENGTEIASVLNQKRVVVSKSKDKITTEDVAAAILEQYGVSVPPKYIIMVKDWGSDKEFFARLLGCNCKILIQAQG